MGRNRGLLKGHIEDLWQVPEVWTESLQSLQIEQTVQTAHWLLPPAHGPLLFSKEVPLSLSVLGPGVAKLLVGFEKIKQCDMWTGKRENVLGAEDWQDSQSWD